MPLLYYNPRLLEHDTGPAHPERPERLTQVVAHLRRSGMWDAMSQPTWDRLGTEQAARLHGPEYLRHLEAFAADGGGRIEADTVCGPSSYDVALLAAGGVCDAVSRVVQGQAQRAFCLIRPPGHHALRESAMGFCLLGNVALAAAEAIETHRLSRVLIVDWDVHHGNGTQAMFWNDPRMGFLSIHRWPFYPGTGDANETGGGDALGTKLNIPLEFGVSRTAYLAEFSRGLTWLAERVRPELVLISAGFDSHRDDPVGSLGLESEDFQPLTRAVVDVANAYAGGRIVSVLEGGYNPGVLAGCVEIHLRELFGLPTS